MDINVEIINNYLAGTNMKVRDIGEYIYIDNLATGREMRIKHEIADLNRILAIMNDLDLIK